MATATFTEHGHIYQNEGISVPSVSQVLEITGIADMSGIPPHILQKAADRGTAVHKACHYLDEDDLVLDSLDPEIVGYVVGYQKFREEYEFKPRLIEHRMVAESAGLPFGMCVDRVGTLKGSELEVVLDIKTARKPSAAWAIQTAAYASGLGGDFGRAAVHLSKDGTFKLIGYQSSDDVAAWQCALILTHWKLRNGSRL